MAAHVHTRIGDRDNAHHAAVRAIDTLSGNRVKTRAIILAEAAYAFAYIGGTERAQQHATEALNLAQSLEVPSAAQRLRELAALLPEPLNNAGQDLRQQSQRARASRTGKARHHLRPAKTDQASNRATTPSEM